MLFQFRFFFRIRFILFRLFSLSGLRRLDFRRFLLLAFLQFVIVCRFLDPEFLVEIVVTHRQVEVRAQLCEDGHLFLRFDKLLFRIAELPACGVYSEHCEYVGHVIVEHVEDVLPVGERHFLLHILVYGSQCLCALVGGFGGERVSEEQL